MLAASASTVQPEEYEVKSLTVKTTGAVGSTDGESFTLVIGKLAVQVFMLNLDVPRTVNYGLMNGDPVQIWPNPKGPI